jgi:uncharacterized protein (TIGR00251 family)
MAAYWEGEALILPILLQPKASRDRLVGWQGDALKITITAPPVDGKANAQLIKFLSKQFKVPKSAITIEAGTLSRHKRVRIRSPKVLPEGLDV